MYKYELEKVSSKIEKLIKKKVFEQKKVYVFGASDNSRQIIQILRKNNINPINIIDNDKYKKNSYYSGIQVVDVDMCPVQDDVIIIIYSFYWQEMKRQLIKYGFINKQIIVLVEKEYTIFKYIQDSIKGKILYEKFQKKYGDVILFLCPYTGTGDIYLIGTFWEEYIKRNHIKNYVFLVINNACEKVAMLFNIKNIEVLKKQKDSAYIITYYLFCRNKIKLKILNDAWAQINDNSSEWLRGYKGLYFTDLFKKIVFDLPKESKPKHPVLKNVDKILDTYFEYNNLINGKTIVISPYSNTLSSLPIVFWKDICLKLRKKGYMVCTNSNGSNEPAIEGSIAVSFPLNIAPQFINRAGGFIGVRSGFCDIISNTRAKKVILYDKNNRFYNCSAYQYFNLSDMELCYDAIEVEYENTNFVDIIESIIKIF